MIVIKTDMREMDVFMSALVTACYPDGSICVQGFPMTTWDVSKMKFYFKFVDGVATFIAGDKSDEVAPSSGELRTFVANLMLYLHDERYRETEIKDNLDGEYLDEIFVTELKATPRLIKLTIRFQNIGNVRFEIRR